jgi:hypothetical protein
VGRIIPNLIAQRTGPINVLITACALSGVLDFVWITAQSTAGILAFNGAFGFVSGKPFPASARDTHLTSA